MLNRLTFSSLLLFIFGTFIAAGQVTKISGLVTDELTHEPIPFATVVFKGTTSGTNTDFDGKYSLSTETPGDSLVFTLVGYRTVKMKVKKGQTQTINVVLKASKVELHEVEIKAGENPANIILKNIIKNKNNNDPTKLEAFQYEVYNKLEFDLTKINDKMKNNKLLKPFAFIWDNIDSSETNSQPFLPFFISETMSDVYFKNNPKNKKEIIKASKVSGLENASVTQFLGDMYQRVDLYYNFIDLFGKSFISPISDMGLIYYRYYLLDSSYIDNQWCYKLKFKPRRPEELTFTGEFWVNDTTWAIKKISMRISQKANINWVEDMAILQEYTYVDGKQWMVSKDMLVLDFATRENGMSFIGRKTTSYKKFHINEEIPENIFKGTENIIVSEDALKKSSDYWDESRHDSLAERELKIYHMVDTIKTLPAFKTYVEIITLFFTGYKDMGLIELGPYYTVYSFNPIEGNRIRIGARTSDEFHPRIQLEGYLAYGFKDEKFKYMGSLKYKLNDKPRQFAGISYRYDIDQLGQSDNAFQDDNILSSIFRRNPANKLNASEITKAWYEIEWFPGLSNKISVGHNYYVPLGDLDISYYADDSKTEVKNTISTSQISIFTRFAYREKFVAGKTDRISLGSDYPVLQINYTKGIKGFLEGDFDFHKLSVKIDDRLRLAPFGYSYWILSMGKTWGEVPYPLLEIHPGNETYFYDYAAFNLMNYFEFVSDYYFSGYITHHFDGFFLDKVPLLKKLKWREIVQLKAIWGEINNTNLSIQTSDDIFYSLNKKPYVEAGVGVENILKILRVDFIWRMSYLENANIAKFGIRGSFQLSF